MRATCETCAHWTSPDRREDWPDAVGVSGYRGDGTRMSDEDRDALAIRWHALYGVCGRPEFCPSADELDLNDPPPMVTRDGSEYMATLFTLGTFSCAAYAALHDADCPMTNERPEARTVCVCDTPGPSGERLRDTPEGGVR